MQCHFIMQYNQPGPGYTATTMLFHKEMLIAEGISHYVRLIWEIICIKGKNVRKKAGSAICASSLSCFIFYLSSSRAVSSLVMREVTNLPHNAARIALTLLVPSANTMTFFACCAAFAMSADIMRLVVSVSIFSPLLFIKFRTISPTAPAEHSS